MNAGPYFLPLASLVYTPFNPKSFCEHSIYMQEYSKLKTYGNLICLCTYIPTLTLKLAYIKIQVVFIICRKLLYSYRHLGMSGITKVAHMITTPRWVKGNYKSVSILLFFIRSLEYIKKKKKLKEIPFICVTQLNVSYHFQTTGFSG